MQTLKTRHILSGALLLPLVIAIILAMAGIALNIWVYVVLAIICPLAAGAVWFLYKETEGKVQDAEKRR
jgi:uncharacterized membrane protein